MPLILDEGEKPFNPLATVGKPEGMIVTRDEFSPPIREGGPPQSDLMGQRGTPTFTDTLVSSFRLENEVVGAVRSMTEQRDFGPEDSTHNPWDSIKDTKYQDHWQSFVPSRNAAETEHIRSRIEMEMEDRRIREASGATGFATDFIASLLSPTNIGPFAMAGRIYKGYGAINAAKSAASVGVAAGGGAALQELALQQQQYLRTWQESMFAIGGATVLGGLLGGGISQFGSRALARASRAIDDDLTRIRTETADIAGMTGPMSRSDPQAVGAASARVVNENITEGAYGLERAFSWQGPLTRVLANEIRAARDVMTRLAEVPFRLRQNAEGIATGPAGGSVETRIKVDGDVAMYRASEALHKAFAEYRYGNPDAKFAKSSAAFADMLKPQQGRLGWREFKSEITKALRSETGKGIEHPNPHVKAAAESFRKDVFEPFKKEAQKLGLFPEDAEFSFNYVMRRYDINAILNDYARFKQILVDHLKGGQARARAELAAVEREIAASRTEGDMTGEVDELSKQFEAERARVMEARSAQANVKSSIDEDAAYLDELTKAIQVQQLDMSNAARMARAKEMGFDTTTPLYHGTKADEFDAFKPSEKGKFGAGVYLAPDAKFAKEWSGDDGRVIEVYVRGRMADDAAWKAAMDAEYESNPARSIFEVEVAAGERLQRDGFAGVTSKSRKETVVYDPSNIRSTQAAFNPQQSAAAKLIDDPVVQILASERLDVETRMADEKAAERRIRAFHGSPHEFDKFTVEAIGSGEGAQAFGHGLYFAESKTVAKFYQDALGGAKVGGKPWDDLDPLHQAAWHISQRDGDRAAASADLASAIDKVNPELDGGYRQRLMRAKRLIDEGTEIPKAELGHMYEVSIKADPDKMLDWDKSLGEQSGFVRKALGIDAFGQVDDGSIMRSFAKSAQREDASGPTIDMAYDAYAATAQNAGRAPLAFDDFKRAIIDAGYRVGRVAGADRVLGIQVDLVPETIRHIASPVMLPKDFIRRLGKGQTQADYLSERGIEGIRYLDANSRNMILGGPDYAETGTRNIVVFDDSLVEIVSRDGVPVKPQDQASAKAEMAQPQTEAPQAATAPNIELDPAVLSAVQGMAARLGIQMPDLKGLDLDGMMAAVSKSISDMTGMGKATGNTADLKALHAKADELRFIADASDQELGMIAADTISTITGSPAARGTNPYSAELLQGRSGPLKARTLKIPDEKIVDFLDDDIERIALQYVRGMAPDVALAREFGDLNLTEDLKRIQDEANNAAAANPERAAEIMAASNKAQQDIQAVTARLRGTLNIAHDPTSFGPRAAQIVKQGNVLRLMGAVLAASISDVPKLLFVHGFRQNADLFSTLVTHLDGLKMAKAEAKELSAGLEFVLSRSGQLWDAFEDMAGHTMPERAIRVATNKFGRLTLMDQWNSTWKQLSGIMTMNRVLRHSVDLMNGKLNPKDLGKLAASGIDEAIAERIAAQYQTHGTVYGRLFLANAEAWDDPLARQALAAAVRREADITVVTPGQERPLWTSGTYGSVVGQFRTFQLVSIQRTLIAGLQEPDAAKITAIAGMIALGMLSEQLKMIIHGKENKSKPKDLGDWMYVGLANSGVLGWLTDADQMAHKVSRGNISVGKFAFGKDQPISRFASQNAVGALLGPTYGAGSDIIQAMGSAASGELKESDIHAMRRLMPYQNLFYISRALRAFEEGMIDAMGIPRAQQRN